MKQYIFYVYLVFFIMDYSSIYYISDSDTLKIQLKMFLLKFRYFGNLPKRKCCILYVTKVSFCSHVKQHCIALHELFFLISRTICMTNNDTFEIGQPYFFCICRL